MRSRPRALPLSLLFVGLTAGGCNVLTGADELDVGRSPGAGDARAPGQGGGDASAMDGGDAFPASDSGETPKADAGPTVLEESFGDASACLGWTAVGPATRQPHTDGHYAAGSCQLCATGPGDVFLEKSFLGPQDARYELAAWAKGSNSPAPQSFTATLLANGGTVSGGQVISPGWVQTHSLRLPASKNATITVRLGLKAATTGDCVLVDDVGVTIR